MGHCRRGCSTVWSASSGRCRPVTASAVSTTTPSWCCTSATSRFLRRTYNDVTCCHALGLLRAGVITHRRRLRPHVALSVAGTHTDPRRPCVEVEAGGRQRRGHLRAEPLSAVWLWRSGYPGGGSANPLLPEREPAPATGGGHRGRRLRDRLRGCTAVLVLVVAAALPRRAKSANSRQLSGHRSAGDLGRGEHRVA